MFCYWYILNMRVAFTTIINATCLGVKTFMIKFLYVVHMQEMHVVFYFHSCSTHFFCRFLKEEWNYLNENISSKECPLRETVWKNLPRKVEKKIVEVIPCSF